MIQSDDEIRACGVVKRQKVLVIRFDHDRNPTNLQDVESGTFSELPMQYVIEEAEEAAEVSFEPVQDKPRRREANGCKLFISEALSAMQRALGFDQSKHF